jgi:hypothetical protein
MYMLCLEQLNKFITKMFLCVVYFRSLFVLFRLAILLSILFALCNFIVYPLIYKF